MPSICPRFSSAPRRGHPSLAFVLAASLVGLLLAGPVSAQSGPITSPPTPAAAAMCAKFRGGDPVHLDACYRACTRWPQDAGCGMLQRFGYEGWAAGGQLLMAMRQGKLPDWSALEPRFPYLREVIEFRIFPPAVHPPWRTPVQRVAVGEAIVALGAFQRADGAGRYDDALAAATRAEKALAGALGPSHPITAVAVNNVGIAHWHAGRYPQAAAAYQRAIAAAGASLGPEDPFQVTLWDNLGAIRSSMADYPGSVAAHREALAISALTAGPDVPVRANILNNLATTLYLQGDLVGARASSLEALALSERISGVTPEVLGHVLGNLAMIYAELGDLATARRYHERNLRQSAATIGERHPDYGFRLANFATLLYRLGDNELARTSLEQALAIYEPTIGKQHPRYAEALSNLAAVVEALGDLQRAAQFATEALKIREAALGPEHPDLANSLNNLASMLSRIGALELAGKAWERAIAIERKALGPARPRVATALHNLGINQIARGDRARGRATLREALALREAALGKDSPKLAPQLEVVAVVEALLGKADPWPMMQRAATLRRAAFWDAVDAADSDVQLLSRSALDDASIDLLLAVGWRGGHDDALWAELLDRTGRATRAELERRYLGHLVDGRPKTAEAAWTALQQVRQASAVARARAARPAGGAEAVRAAAADVEQAEAAQRSAEAALRKAWPAWAARTTRREVTTDATCAVLRREKAAMVHWLRTDAQPLANALQASAQKAGGPADATPPGAVEPASAASPTDAPAGQHDGIWRALVVVPDGKRCRVTRVDLGDAATIDKAVEAFRTAIAAVEEATAKRRLPQVARKRLQAAAGQLGERVWAPLRPALGTVSRAYLVPQASLLEVPIAALPGADGKPVAATMELAVLPVPALLSAPAASPARAGEGALVVGALDFAAPPAVARQATALWQRCQQRCEAADEAPLQVADAGRGGGARACGWQKLAWPSVGAEALEVARDLGARWRGQGVWLVTGAGGEQTALEAAMPGKRLLHFGTHGFFAPAAGCAGVEHQRPGLLADTPARAGLDPMQLSALVLSGANVTDPDADPAHDDALTAREIVGLDLTGVEVATLAACETGRGAATAGEGAQGLGKAFLVAGVREVLVSLWQVPDRATTTLMQDLYAGLPARATPGQATHALVAAQRKLAAQATTAGDENNLYDWGAFVPLVAGPVWSAAAAARK